MITFSETIESLLKPYQSVLGEDFDGYRNHLYRLINFCHLLHPLTTEQSLKIEIAAVFHDLALWTEDSADYIPASEELARSYLKEIDLIEWTDEVAMMIREHHKITATHSESPLIEAFRKADWIDLSYGFRSFGLKQSEIKLIQQRFPDQSFHPLLIKKIRSQFIKHPFNPLPMFKW